jgi:hypothetical protein
VDAMIAGLKPGGLLMLTCATDQRPKHSAFLEGEHDGEEYYGGVSICEFLRHVFNGKRVFGWVLFEHDPVHCDLKFAAIKL